jgi:hypothetical protein
MIAQLSVCAVQLRFMPWGPSVGESDNYDEEGIVVEAVSVCPSHWYLLERKKWQVGRSWSSLSRYHIGRGH